MPTGPGYVLPAQEGVTNIMSTDATWISARESTGGGVAGMLGVLATRGLLPVWLLVGAVLKLADVSPTHLPTALIAWLGPLGIDLGFVVRFSIAVELTVVVVIWLLPSLARPVALAMLAAFLPILVGDLALGASSCGCFGAVEVNPWWTLTMDAGLLLAVLLLGRRAPSLRWQAHLGAGRVVVAGVATLAVFAIAFAVHPAAAPTVAAHDDVASATAAAAPLPAAGYYSPDLQSWVGQRFADLDVASWIRGLPDDLDDGLHYVLFYRKDCEHCHELMEVFFADDLTIPTTAVAVPERAGFPDVALPFPCGQCGLAELPTGIDWFLQTPVLVRLNQGVVECASATSAADPVCLAL